MTAFTSFRMEHYVQRFDTFEQWVSRASSWLTRHPDYRNTEHGETPGWRGHHFTAICFDARGRICRQGADFDRAAREGAFPVRWVWPDQIPPLLLLGQPPEAHRDILPYLVR